MRHALSRLDAESRAFGRRSALRLAWYGGCAALGWLLSSRHSLPALVNGIEFACTVGAVLATCRALQARTRVDLPSLSYWDESLMLSFVSLGLDLGMRLAA